MFGMIWKSFAGQRADSIEKRCENMRLILCDRVLSAVDEEEDVWVTGLWEQKAGTGRGNGTTWMPKGIVNRQGTGRGQRVVIEGVG